MSSSSKTDELKSSSANKALELSKGGLYGSWQKEECTEDVTFNFDAASKALGSIEYLNGNVNTIYSIPVLPSLDNLIHATVLSVWDNIAGPVAKYVWTQQDGEQQNESETSAIPESESNTRPFNVVEAIRYAVRYSLQGELDKNYTYGQVDDVLFIVSDQGFVVCAGFFGAGATNQYWRGNHLIPHSLSIVLPYNELEYYLNIHKLCLEWLHRIINRITVLIDKNLNNTEMSKKITSYMIEFCNVLQSLKGGKLHSTNFLSQLQEFTPSLLGKAITSHLQTLGCTIVLGDLPQTINLMVHLLARFLDEKEQCCCRCVIEGKDWSYKPGLMVQGILKDEFGEAGISSHDVLCSRYPTTIVDLCAGQVRQSSSYPQHLQHRKEAIRQEAYSLYAGTEISSGSTESLFTKVTESGVLVKTLLNEIGLLKIDTSKTEVMIMQFRRLLEYKAFSAIKCYTTLRHETNPGLRKKLRKMLDLEDDADYRIVIAIAEKLKTGIYVDIESVNIS